MGFVPLFIMLGALTFLFFMSVKNTLNNKLTVHAGLLERLKLLNPSLGITIENNSDPTQLTQNLKEGSAPLETKKSALEILREMKLNRMQYNDLLKTAPYNWVGKIAGFHTI
jgi:hypothetical protein